MFDKSRVDKNFVAISRNIQQKEDWNKKFVYIYFCSLYSTA